MNLYRVVYSNGMTDDFYAVDDVTAMMEVDHLCRVVYYDVECYWLWLYVDGKRYKLLAKCDNRYYNSK